MNARWCLSFLLLVACGGDSSGDTQAVTDALAADATPSVDGTVDAHGDAAPSDGSTSKDTGAPPVAACTSDEECGADELCACDGACVTSTGSPCEVAKNCGSGTWCNLCSGQCEPTVGLCEPCLVSGICGLDAVCVPLAAGGSFCGAACGSDAGCEAGYSCVNIEGVDTDQCVPDTGDCVALGLCENSGECPDGEKCLNKQCVEGCTEDGSCPLNNVCVSAECVPPCVADTDCAAPATCDDDGHCRAPGWCENGADCTPGEHCDKVLHSCEPGCLSDTDCQDAALACESSQCVAKGCLHNYECGFEQECDGLQGECIPTPDPHCGTCDASQEDNSAACGGPDALCATLQDKDEVEQGDFCLLPCKDDPVDKCPQSYGCTHIELPDAGIDGWYCTRECWVGGL